MIRFTLELLNGSQIVKEQEIYIQKPITQEPLQLQLQRGVEANVKLLSIDLGVSDCLRVEVVLKQRK